MTTQTTKICKHLGVLFIDLLTFQTVQFGRALVRFIFVVTQQFRFLEVGSLFLPVLFKPVREAQIKEKCAVEALAEKCKLMTHCSHKQLMKSIVFKVL